MISFNSSFLVSSGNRATKCSSNILSILLYLVSNKCSIAPFDFLLRTLYARSMIYLALTLPGGQTINPPAGIPQGGITVTSSVIGNAVTIMLIVAAILALIFLIYGGIRWITSGGDKQKVAAARARITYAI